MINKVLAMSLKVRIVTKIAFPKRFKIYLYGKGEDSVATPITMRTDALYAASKLILEIEKIGMEEDKYTYNSLQT